MEQALCSVSTFETHAPYWGNATQPQKRLNRTGVGPLTSCPWRGKGSKGKREPDGQSCKGSLREEGSLNGLWMGGTVGQGGHSGPKKVKK